MSSSEFESRLGAEPRETAAALRSESAPDPDRLRAAEEAEAFEDRLESVLRVPVDEAALVASLLDVPRRRAAPPRWLAMAASLFLVVGLFAVLIWRIAPSGDVADYVRDHYRLDGADVMASAHAASTAPEIRAVLAGLGASPSAELTERIRYIKFCPTPDGRGAHMVLSGSDGPVTVIFMPSVQVAEPLLLRFDGMEARVVDLPTGSAAIIGGGAADVSTLPAMLRSGLQPLGADT